MNYTELVTAINNYAEDAFTTENVDNFIRLAEIEIYNSVQFPDMRRNVTGTTTMDGKYLTLPTDFLYPLSCAVLVSGVYEYLLNKDTNFIQEAYPDPTATGVPKHYSLFSSSYFLLGPTPDAAYSMELHYVYYPETIITATNTWLGDQFEPVLLNGALVEAARFQKEEPDVIANYEKLYSQSLALLKNLADGKMRQDTYRAGQVRNEPI